MKGILKKKKKKKKKIDERRDYESVDEKILAQAMLREITKKRIHAIMG